MISNWTTNLRPALRSLLRTPGFTILAVGTLGLAIGANAGIFSVIDKVLLEPLPYANGDRLVVLAGTAPGSDLPEEFPLVGQDPENRRTISSPGYVVKTARAEEIAADIRALVREVAPNAPMYRTYTMEFLAADSMVQLSFTTLTLGIASILALILGVVGLYGVLSYAVAERTREIGLRMALGAAADQVRWMVVGQGARALAAGVVIGAGIAAVASRALRAQLFEIGAFDPGTYLAVSALMVFVGLAATYLPARRASAVDPMESLRDE